MRLLVLPQNRLQKLPVLLLLLLCLLCACQEQTLPPGTVASVNGELISLHSVQALLDSRSAALGITHRPSVTDMQASYREALAILIAHTLVRQELAEKGLGVSENEMEEAIDQIRDEFDGLADFLAEASLREDEWRQLMRDHLALRIFTERELLPSIKISLSEVQAYYTEHEKDFSLPENGLVCYAAADSREALEAWCGSLNDSEFSPGPLAHCMRQPLSENTPPWELKKIRQRTCGKILEQDGQWRTVAIREKAPASQPRLSEIYGLIENILIEQKKLAAFNEWLEKKMAAASILGSPWLFPASQ